MVTEYRCVDCRDPRWSTTNPAEARRHAARFDCLILPDPGRPPPTPEPADQDTQQLALDI